MAENNAGVLTLQSPTPHLIAEKEGAIGRLVFNKPVRMNAVSLDMWQAIPQLMAKFEADDDIRVIVLRGAGDKAFISGADISQSDDANASANHERHHTIATRAAFEALENVSKPTIALIHGVCMGGGLAIASTCDLRYAAESATFGIPAARLGLAYPPDAVRRLTAIIGPAFAKEIFFTARNFNLHDAIAMGFVNRGYPSGDLDIHVRDTCRTIAQNAPLTIKTAKIAVDALLERHEEDVFNDLQELADLCSESRDYAEGRQAFMEKRKPAFHGY